MRHPILNTVPGTAEASAFYIDSEIDQLDRYLKIETRKARAARPVKRSLTEKEMAAYDAENPGHRWK